MEFLIAIAALILWVALIKWRCPGWPLFGGALPRLCIEKIAVDADGDPMDSVDPRTPAAWISALSWGWLGVGGVFGRAPVRASRDA